MSTLSGKVFLDKNRNQKLDVGEPGIPGVSVSNGFQVVSTDLKGTYKLPVCRPSHIFVIKPPGYKLPLDSDNIPEFFYLHAPNGSPQGMDKYRGLEQTGKLPDRVNFPLYRTQTRESFFVFELIYE